MRQGMPPSFLLLWASQSTSLLGSSVLGFALGVWTFEQTGSATQFALITLAATLPGLLLSPFVGVLVDRWDRRWAMILGDGSGAVMTGVLLALHLSGRLEVVHLYGAVVVTACAGALQQPAFAATVPLLVERRHLGRAAGWVQSAASMVRLVSPVLGGVMLATLTLTGVLWLDLLTAAVAGLILLSIRIPRPPAVEGEEPATAFLQRLLFGWRYVRSRVGLLILLLLFAAVNLAFGMVQVLLPPLVLTLSGPATLGIVLSCLSGGFLAGSLWLGATGGPRRKVPTMLALIACQGGLLILAGWRPSTLLIGVATTLFMTASAVIVGCSQVLWQTKVPPGAMGRVFAVRQMVALSTTPLAYLVAGPLVDRVFNPLVGTGAQAGEGIALLFRVLGIATICIVSLAAFSPRLRLLEEEVPDALEPALGQAP